MNSVLLYGVFFLVGGAVGVFMWVTPLLGRAGRAVVPGSLKVKKHTYSYELGDNLFRPDDGTTFSGIDMHARTRELSANKLAELQEIGGNYQLEIGNGHVRLTAPRSVLIAGDAGIKDDLLKTAKAVMKDLDHHVLQ